MLGSRFVLWVSFLLVLSFTGFSQARVINIPDDEETIQAGIDEAEDGDTVLVQPGRYIENINFNGKNITVASLFLTTRDEAYIDSTVIDADSSGSVVRFDSEEDENSILTGFTLTGGIGSPDNRDDICGGGIHCYQASPTLSRLKVIENSAEYGGGIFLKQSTAIITHLMVSENFSEMAGGGIHLSNSSPIIIKNIVIRNNEAGTFGGGIRCWDRSEINLINVTILGNSSSYYGGGIAVNGGNFVSIVNSILRNNSSNHGSELGLGAGEGMGDTVVVIYSNIQYLEDSVYVRAENSHVRWGEGNIDEDPLFVDPDEGDYHLTADSPCIDAGDPESPEDPDGTRTDMGAFYFHQRDIEVEPEFIEFIGTQTGTADSLSLAIHNVGNTPLHVEFPEIIPAVFPFRIIPDWEIVTVEPRSSYPFGIVFEPQHQAEFWGVLSIESDDPDEEIVEIPLFGTALSVDVDDNQPLEFGISGVYPNPFNSTATIRYELPRPSHISLSVYDLAGRLVETLVDERVDGGEYAKSWQAGSLPSGLYFVKLADSRQTAIRKLMLVK